MMMKRLTVVVAATLLLTLNFSTPVAVQEATEYGPPTGSLVIVGGGSTNDTTIMEKFIELGGGAEEGRFVIVPTAGGNRDNEGNIRTFDAEAVLRGWVNRGVKNATMLHTHDAKVADTAAFVEPLLNATAVWFNGGRQWNIVDSYMGTRTYTEFHNVLKRGGVVGGSSAGATIQGDYLVRGDTSGSNVVMTDEVHHQKGFEFLRKSAIDQHINARNRWDDIIPVIEQNPGLLGIGLSEGTAIVVTGDRFEVMGKWKVAIHDNTHLYQPWEKPYYVLSPGDVYNMKTRKIEKLGDGTTPSAAGRGGRGRGRGRGQNPPAPEAPATPEPTGVVGKWTVSVETPQGSRPSSLEIKLDGEKVTGTMESTMGSVPIEGEYKDETLGFLISMQTGNGPFGIYFSGRLQADGTLAGTADMGEVGQLTWTAQRVKDQ